MGLVIDVDWDTSVNSAPAAFKTGVLTAVQNLESLFTNPVTVTIDVGYGEIDGQSLESDALGESETTDTLPESYAAVKNALLAQNAPGSSTLPSTSPDRGTLDIYPAEAKALGLAPNNGGVDGYVGFSSTLPFSYANGTTPPGNEFYFIGVVEHEISEDMGRVSLLDEQPADYSTIDLYRYSSAGVRDRVTEEAGGGSTAYFSIDGGTTNLGTWNNQYSNGDLADWYPSGPAPGGADAFNDYSSPGVLNVMSQGDITLMEALGYETGPTPPSGLTLSPASDSGVKGDDITNVTTPAITGVGVAGGSVTLLDGSAVVGTGTVGSGGTWSIATSTLPTGINVLTATETDGAGNTSAASAALDLTIKTSAPSPSGLTLSPASDSGIKGDDITHVTTPTIAGAGEVGDTVDLYDGTTLVGTGTVASGGAWSIAASALAEGTNVLTATETDVAGNVSPASAALDVTIKTSAPSPPSGLTLPPASDSGVKGDGTTSVTTPTIIGFGEIGDTVTLLEDATAVGTGVVGANGGWLITAITPLAPGGHVLTATETDIAGNVSVISSALPITIYSITGFGAGRTITSNQTTHPFSGLTIGGAVALTVTLSDATNGILSNLGAGSYNAATGTYTDNGTASAITVDLDGLVFTPTPNRVAPGSPEITTFTVSAGNSTDPAVAQYVTSTVVNYVANHPNDLGHSSTASGSNHFIDLLNFEASYSDLINAFGTNQQAMQNWYNTYEPTEGRVETFDGLDYVAGQKDLIAAFGSAGSPKAVQDDGATHYINFGLSEGRSITFNGLDYIASYGDLIKSFGADNDSGAYHYIEFGENEGRTTTFDGLDYIASYGDLIKTFGANEQAGAVHYIDYGFDEGRTTTFDGLDYVASYGDLIKTLGANNDAGAQHYIDFGYAEGRTVTFDGLDYIANYTDLMTALGANNDAGATHYIDSGFNEGRSTTFNVAAYEFAHPDLVGHYATNDQFLTAYINTYVTTGHFLT